MKYTDVNSFAALRDYLLQVRPFDSSGRRVERYRIRTRWETTTNGFLTTVEALTDDGKWRYYGDLDDVFHNVDAGLLDPHE